MISSKQIVLIGGGGHCHSCIDVIENEDRFKIAGIVDRPQFLGTKVLGYNVLWTDSDLPSLVKDFCFLITIGQIRNVEPRKRIFEILLSQSADLPVIISNLAYVSRYAKIGFGTIIMHRAVVNAGATIGENCIINTASLIEHDVRIGNHCHISTAAVVNGGVEIGSETFFGSNATSNHGIVVPDKSFIKAGSITK